MKKKVDIANEASELSEVIAKFLDRSRVRDEGLTILAYATELMLAAPFGGGNIEGYDEMSKAYKTELDNAHEEVANALYALLQNYN